MVLTPFNLNSSGATLDPGISEELLPQFLIRDSRAVGLSDKEIVRLRAEALNSPQPRVSALNISQPTSSPNAIQVTESGELPYDTRRLHSEFETLRWEVERLRADGLVVTAPPGYAEGDG